jgi:enterobactin synthetase component D
VGSITHAAGHALAAVALRDQCGGLGLDLEHQDRAFLELGQKVAYDEELAWLNAVPARLRSRAALELFSAKETIYKAFFPRVGRPFGFGAARARPMPGGGYEAWLVEDIDWQYPRDRSFHVDCTWHDDLVLTSLVLPP